MIKVYYIRVSMDSKGYDINMIKYEVPKFEFNDICDTIGGSVFTYKSDEVFEVDSNDIRCEETLNLLTKYLVKAWSSVE